MSRKDFRLNEDLLILNPSLLLSTFPEFLLNTFQNFRSHSATKTFIKNQEQIVTT
jgi:hypothetical protein